MMSRYDFGAVGVLIAFAAAANAQTASTGVDTIFSRFATANSPGCAVGVMRGVSPILARAYGVADLEHDVPLSPQSVFYMASVSKEFTALAILLLEQDGKIRLSDPIRRYVPELPTSADAITLADLLHHTSGLRDYLTLFALAGHPPDYVITERDFLSRMSKQDALNFVPRTEFLYSNTGYVLLSMVVKRVSGQRLDDFARQRIFNPLGMQSTRFQHDHAVPIPRRAIGYIADSSRWRIANSPLDVVGDGGLYSTVDDMMRWATAWYRPEFARLLDVMATPGKLADGRPIASGYGMGLASDTYRQKTRISHGGSLAGYRTSFMRFPSDSLAVVTLCNNSAANPTRLSEMVAEKYVTMCSAPPAVAQSGSAPAPRASLPVSSKLAQELSGVWYSQELDATYRMATDSLGFAVVPGVSAPVYLRQLTPDSLTAPGGRELVVIRDARGRITRLLLNAGRVRDIVFTKQP